MADLNVTVDGLVPAIAQPTPNTCWATAAAILYSWRTQSSSDIATILSAAAPRFLPMFQADQALPGREKGNLLQSLGLTTEPPEDFSVDGWAQLIQNNGALWVTTNEGAGQNFSAHARILKGISGDGYPDTTFMDIIDPGDGSEYRESVTDFTRKFDEVAIADMGAGVKFRPQVVHY
jgi:Papain-like cysteine protease AvrRpt2